ncbi:MAG TPA: c-type cytochrome [Phototrophicaceae bacterium]|nr:c-type cytochrome [Phototrophicaceae bacterium]
MHRSEWFARVALLFILLLLPIAILVYQYGLRPLSTGTRIIDIRASVPEAGGFQPASLQVQAGETVTLRFSSTDVTHGIAIGPGLGVDLGQVDPGQVKEVTLTFDHAGTYTFYCNTWCSLNHWRMRGVLEVRDQMNRMPTPQRDPVIEALATAGIDIDAGLHETAEPMTMTLTPVVKPAAERGEVLLNRLSLPPALSDADWRRSHTPQEAITLLATLNPNTSEAELADAVAYLWTQSGSTTLAKDLYAKNCAACHGQTGGGDGPFAATTAKKPVAFADVAYMFTRRGDVLYAKIRRGGMGTDMPNFGTLFTPEETWALVDYLWSLALNPAAAAVGH